VAPGRSVSSSITRHSDKLIGRRRPKRSWNGRAVRFASTRSWKNGERSVRMRARCRFAGAPVDVFAKLAVREW
jgi:hypothetical protein